ncbi:MAG: (Fe-S)-binding protein, partial [Pseudomonadota bacterium]
MKSIVTRSLTPLEDSATQFYHCANCNYCVDAVWDEREIEHVCPTLQHHSPALSFSGRGYMNLARALYEGEEFPLTTVADRVFTCTTCGNCERICPIDLSPRDMNMGLRQVLFDQGAAPTAILEYREQHLATEAISAELIQHIKVDKALVESISLDAVDTVFLTGCTGENLVSSEIHAALDIVQQVHPNVDSIFRDGADVNGCCGKVFKEIGDTAAANEQLRGLSAKLNVYPNLARVIHVATSCSDRFEDDPRVIDFPQWLTR